MKQFRMALLALIVLAPGILAADGWTTWRGPHQSGSVAAPGTFPSEGFTLQVAWSHSIGSSYAAIAVSNGRAFTMYADDKDDLLVALDLASGKERWRYRIGDRTKGHDGSHDGPLSSPVIAGGRVFALAANGDLIAVDEKDGRELWRTSIVDELGAEQPYFGFSCTPLPVGDRVVIQAGGAEGKALAAFSAATGKLEWAGLSGKVHYQSPLSVTIAGRAQIVAVMGQRTVGVDPSNGRELWSYEYEGNSSATAVALPDNRLLIPGKEGLALIRVVAEEAGLRAEPLWTSATISPGFAMPVVVDNHIYGFNGKFLTCAALADGNRVWRSRPPGGRGLISVDDHLVIFGSDGHLVVAEATPTGYEEQARVRISDSDGYTWPSFSDGLMLVRNLTDIAAVRVKAASPAAANEPIFIPMNAFEEFLIGAEGSGDAQSRVDAFLSEQESFPIIEGQHWIHFVYQGEAEDVAVRGTLEPFQVERQMQRLSGTDLFYRSYDVEPGARFEYQFVVDFDEIMRDPLNQTYEVGHNNLGEMSVAYMPGYVVAEWARDYTGDQRGQMETLTLSSKILENKREVDVYLPRGYQDNGHYPLVIINAGNTWLDGKAQDVLDWISDEEMRPAVVAFVHEASQGSWREFGGKKTREYGKMIVDELLPVLQKRYAISDSREERILAGRAGAGAAALQTALDHRDLFGGVFVQSYSRSDDSAASIEAGLEQDGPPLTVFVGWNLYDLHDADGEWNIRDESRELYDAIDGSSFSRLGAEAVDSAGWGSWRAWLGEALIALLPGAAAE